MGTLYHQMVICITYDWETNDRSKLDKLVIAHPNLFAKSGELINGVVNYVMFWDGSKEGWDDSNKGDDLRAEFLDLCRKLEMVDIYEINDHEEGEPTLIHTPVYNPRSSTGSANK